MLFVRETDPTAGPGRTTIYTPTVVPGTDGTEFSLQVEHVPGREEQPEGRLEVVDGEGLGLSLGVVPQDGLEYERVGDTGVLLDAESVVGAGVGVEVEQLNGEATVPH